VSSSNQVTNQVLRDKYEAIHLQLVETYGEPTWRPHLPPVDELVNTILSQSTSDTNRDYAFAALRERFPDWESVIAAPEEEVREAIRPAGLANQKAPRIQKALREILHHQGELSLEFLREMPLEAAEKWLTDIKGVGPKTAAIVLLFAFGRPAFPVDTHVHRVTRRLGLIGPKVSAEKAHNLLREIGQPETFYAFHLNIIRHGRQVCHARNPKCSVCPLSELCLYFKQEFEA
jgi:endonuclease-3